MSSATITFIQVPRQVRNFLRRNPFVLEFFLGLVTKGIITGEERDLVLRTLEPLVDMFGKIAPSFFQSVVANCEEDDFPENVSQYCVRLPEKVMQRFNTARTSFWLEAIRHSELNLQVMFRYWCVPVRCIMRLHEMEHQFGIHGKA